jgi:3-methyladenine DNA glycosylase AlkD
VSRYSAAMNTLLKSVQRDLKRVADPATKAGAERYFKNAVKARGVKRAGVTAIERALRPRLLVLSHQARMELALTLLRAPTLEDRQVGLGVLAREIKALPDDFVDEVAVLFDDVVRDWASCDMLCSKVLRPLVVRSPDARKRVVAWSRAANPWRRRAAAVAFVNEARTGDYDAAILHVCARIANDPDRFVQLGCGWVLRELWLASPDTTVAFLQKHMTSLSREGLRYAIEKMPKNEQARLLALHTAASKGRLPRRRSR